MKQKSLVLFFLFYTVVIFSQDTLVRKKWLRSGIIVGFASQNTFVKQEWDYTYENKVIKFSNHFNIIRKGKNSWEVLLEPSYYRSKHQMINFWSIKHNLEDGYELRLKYMALKSISEYVLNIGVVYRRYLNTHSSIYATLNSGPMYIDTDTERLKKGFAFSDVISVGYNYRLKKWSLDGKFMFRHASNANLQMPNYGLNSAGFEFGTYYEFN